MLCDAIEVYLGHPEAAQATQINAFTNYLERLGVSHFITLFHLAVVGKTNLSVDFQIPKCLLY